MIEWDSSKPNGQPKRLLDTSKAKNQLKWQNETSLITGLKKTIEWYYAKQF